MLLSLWRRAAQWCARLTPTETPTAAAHAALDHAFAGVRGLLAVLVVYGHVGNVFRSMTPAPTDPLWVRVLEATAPTMSMIRMPAFFVLAGMLAWQSLQRRGGGRAYLSKRLMRLGLPLLSVIVLINPVEVWLRLHYGAFLGRSYDPSHSIRLIPGLLDGTTVLHLWFLQVLVYLTVVTPLLARGMARLDRLGRLTAIVGLLFVGALVQVRAWHADVAIAPIIDPHWGSPSQLLLAFRFLAVGMLLAADAPLLLWMVDRVRSTLGVLAVGLLFVSVTVNRPGIPMVAVHAVAGALLPLSCLLLMTNAFRRLPTWRRAGTMVNASGYTLYLWHHSLCVAGAVITQLWLGHTFAACALTLVVAVVLPVLLDRNVIRPVSLLALFFTGVRPAARRRMMGRALVPHPGPQNATM